MSTVSLKRSLFAALAAALLICAVPAAKADFTGPYAIANWTLTNTSADGSFNTNPGPPIELFLTGGDDQSGNSGTTDFTISAVAGGLVSFDWGYDSVDDPGFDSGGYVINGVYTELDNDFTAYFTGSISFAVNQGDVFGFRVDTVDNGFGPGIFGATNFIGPTSAVPEPATMALAGLGGLGCLMSGRRLWRRRKSKKAKAKAEAAK